MSSFNVMRMNVGDGQTSYAKNSSLQRIVISKTLPLLDDTLADMLANPNLSSQKCYRIADFGCGSGSNSLWVMAHIINTIENKCKEKRHGIIPKFVGYLNDLPDNDFNNLFKCLPNLYGKEGEEKRHCFMYAVPGSFYERLFTEKTLHFAYSSYSLHWLSQVPEGLENGNKENIFLEKESSPKVHDAYAKQFHGDFSTFLRQRAEEMVQGGRMVISSLGRSPENSYGDFAWVNLVGKSLLDMVIEGLVDREDLYSFNVPMYQPSKTEVYEAVENEGSFTLQRSEIFDVAWDTIDSASDELEDPLTDNKCGKIVASCIRAVMEPMLTKHFGGSIMDNLFEKYANKVRDYMSTNKSTFVTMVFSLERI